MFRQLIRKLGKFRTGLLITIVSILISVCVRWLISLISAPNPKLISDLIVSATIPLLIAPGMAYIFVGLLTDVDKAEQENAKLVTELQKALATAKTLSGLLPICATCKKIRDDAGYWHQVESYICKHADVDFSHGICPDCMAELKAEIAAKKREMQSTDAD